MGSWRLFALSAPSGLRHKSVRCNRLSDGTAIKGTHAHVVAATVQSLKSRCVNICTFEEKVKILLWLLRYLTKNVPRLRLSNYEVHNPLRQRKKSRNEEERDGHGRETRELESQLRAQPRALYIPVSLLLSSSFSSLSADRCEIGEIDLDRADQNHHF